ncbi:hypothetical protein LCD36_04445 [Saccharopolyspora sp. 6T]|uniref:hypothetical protein n=1 Tax=Saccharopolyspora sp. 6T TaxID=2877238 RepID=UPI001CD3E302|nr:hypothetical protein [Saccharopolyspora sp. 6T]MCA1185701.1 hypothetical protein [Saccharopolyspora sp. 6T]
MQYPDDVELTQALSAHNRRFSARLMVDWNRNGLYDHPYSDLSKLVVEATTDRSMEGALPENATLIEGYSAAQLTLHLEGRRAYGEPNAAQLFAPYSTRSPLYGLPRKNTPAYYEIVVHTVTGVRTIRQFTGWTREIDASSADGTATLRCLDFAEPLRAPITLPRWAHFQRADEGRLINSQWLIDHILRRNGYHQSPPMVPDCRFSATLHGARIVESGVPFGGEDSTGPANAWTQGRYGLALAASSSAIQVIGSGSHTNLPHSNGVTYGFGTFVEIGGSGLGETTFSARYGSLDYVALVISAAGQVSARFQRYDGTTSTWNATGPTLSGTGWVYVGMEATVAASNMQVRFNVDGAITSTTAARWAPANTNLPSCGATLQRPAQCLQHWQSTTRTNNWSWTPQFAPTATLSQGLNLLSHLPDILDEASWDVLKELVHAEFGTLFADEHNHVWFLNREDARQSKSTIDREIGPDQLVDVSVSDPSDAIVNCIAVSSTLGMYKITKRNWSATNDDQLTFPAGSTTITVTDVPDSWTFFPTVPYWDNATWDNGDNPVYGFFPVHASTGSTAPNVTISVNQLSQRSFSFTVSNGNAYAIRLADKALTDANSPGTPRLRVGGTGIIYWPTKKNMLVNQASIDIHGRRLWEIPDTRWAQSYSGQAVIANSLLAELASPLPVLDHVSIVGDPRLQLTDAIPIRDPDGLGEYILGQVVGIRQTLGSNGLSADLTMRLLNPPGEGIWDSPTYGIWDQSFIWAT